MKVKDVLNSNISEGQADYIEYLTSIHIGTLKAIRDDRFDHTGASERMMDVIGELQAYKFVDDRYKVTPSGLEALAVINSMGGGAERRRAAKLKDVKVDDDDIYHDEHSRGMETDDDDSIYQMNRTGSFNPYV